MFRSSWAGFDLPEGELEMLCRRIASSLFVALAAIGIVPNSAIAYPVTELVAYRSGEVYTYNGENYQDVMVGVSLMTDPAYWGYTGSLFGYDQLVVRAATFGWFAQPLGTTENILVSRNMFLGFEYGDNVPSEIFLSSYYSVKAPGGDFVMSGVLAAYFDLMFLNTPEAGGTTVTAGAYSGPPIEQLQAMADSVAFAQITNTSGSLSISINDIVVPPYSEGSGFTGRSPEFVQANFDSLLQRPNLIGPNQYPAIPFEETISRVSEPGSLGLVGVGILAFVMLRRRRVPCSV